MNLQLSSVLLYLLHNWRRRYGLDEGQRAYPLRGVR
jgi:hypothetical protein